MALAMIVSMLSVGAFAADVSGLSGTGIAEDPYLINNIDELKWFRDDVNAGNAYNGLYVKLTADIDLENENWTPIGNSTNQFKGVFDGGNYTVSNLKIDSQESYIGFFGYTSNGELRNLTIHNADIDGRLGVGTLAGSSYTSKVTNITLTGKVTIDAKFYVGGVAGRNAYNDFTDITVDVEEGSYVKADSVEEGTAYRTYVGGVVGFMGEGDQVLKNVTSNIDVIGTTCDVGGIVGIAHYGNSFINNSSSGDVKLTSADDVNDALEIGGIAGVWHNKAGYTVAFKECTYTGTLYSAYTNELGEQVVLEKSGFMNGGLIGKAYDAGAGGEPAIYAVKIEKDADDEYYLTLADALAAAQDGDVIDLLGNTAALDATIDVNKSITITNGAVDATDVEFTSGFGVLTGAGEKLIFEDVDFIVDGAKAFQGFFYNEGTIEFIGGSVTATGTYAAAIFHGGEREPVGTFIINGTEITLSELEGRGFLYPTLDIDGVTITITDIGDNAMRSVSGTIDSSVITVDGAEYGIKNKGFEGVLNVTNSQITIVNTENDDGENAGIYLESEDALVVDEDSVINSSMFIAPSDENSEPTIYYVLTFADSELAAVSALKGTEIDLSEYTTELSGYKFDGWYADAELTEAVTSITLDADMTVYAKWTEKRTGGSGGGLQAGGNKDRTGEDDLTVKDEDENKDNEDNTDVTVPTGWINPFADVAEGDWFFENVKYAYDNGLMNGTASDKFSPNGGVTRAMLVTVLWRAEGSPTVEGDAEVVPFADVADGMYYTDAVAWAQANGIVNGVSETEFAPDKLIIREQIAAIMHRYAAYKGDDVSAAETTDILYFADYDNISEYAIPSLRYAVGSGLINGKTASKIAPTDTATRAETAAILQRFIEEN